MIDFHLNYSSILLENSRIAEATIQIETAEDILYNEYPKFKPIDYGTKVSITKAKIELRQNLSAKSSETIFKHLDYLNDHKGYNSEYYCLQARKFLLTLSVNEKFTVEKKKNVNIVHLNYINLYL